MTGWLNRTVAGAGLTSALLVLVGDGLTPVGQALIALAPPGRCCGASCRGSAR